MINEFSNMQYICYKPYRSLGVGLFGEQDGVILPELRSDLFDSPLRNDLCRVSLGDFHSLLLV